MIERRKRGRGHTGPAALGAALMAIALAASPVGAIPFAGESTGQFWFVATSDSNGDGVPGAQSLTSGYSSLAGAGQCSSFLEYQLAPAPSGTCDGVESNAVPGGWAACQNEDGDGVVWAEIVDATACTPLSCFDADNNIVEGCTVQQRTEVNILGGDGSVCECHRELDGDWNLYLYDALFGDIQLGHGGRHYAGRRCSTEGRRP